MIIESVPLSSIDTADGTFVTGHKGGISPVRESISEIGLINFPVLRRKGKTLQIITGWKRILAVKELGWTEITSKVYEPEELSDEACLKYIYHDNSGRMDDMELAELVVKFRDMLCIEDREMIREVLPFLGIPPSRNQLDRSLLLAALDDCVKEAYYRDRITIEQCQMLSESPLSGLASVLSSIIVEYKLNNNESRQVIKDIEDVALRDKRAPAELLRELHEKIGSGGKNDLRAELRKIRYPVLTRVEESYYEAVNSIGLPRSVTIHTQPYFEGNEIEIRIRAGNAEELFDALSALESAAEDGRIERLISIVREGK